MSELERLHVAGDSLMAAARSLAYAWETESPDRVMWDEWKKVQPAAQAWVDARRVEDDEPAAVDWPARFRTAAETAEGEGPDEVANTLRFLANAADLPTFLPPYVVEAIGRALLGEQAETELTNGDTTHA